MSVFICVFYPMFSVHIVVFTLKTDENEKYLGAKSKFQVISF